MHVCRGVWVCGVWGECVCVGECGVRVCGRGKCGVRVWSACVECVCGVRVWGKECVCVGGGSVCVWRGACV